MIEIIVAILIGWAVATTFQIESAKQELKELREDLKSIHKEEADDE
ncbi:MAG: hypothetical protein KAJ40_02370 [Alphaproteobacteria bacterium]|nr:hypothetical protein [Alphaproteobacteria bacterium]